MSILRNKYEIIDEEENKGYTVPAVVKNDDEAINFKKAVALSTLLHPGSVGLTWGLITLLALLGINIHLFKFRLLTEWLFDIIYCSTHNKIK